MIFKPYYRRNYIRRLFNFGAQENYLHNSKKLYTNSVTYKIPVGLIQLSSTKKENIIKEFISKIKKSFTIK